MSDEIAGPRKYRPRSREDIPWRPSPSRAVHRGLGRIDGNANRVGAPFGITARKNSRIAITRADSPVLCREPEPSALSRPHSLPRHSPLLGQQCDLRARQLAPFLTLPVILDRIGHPPDSISLEPEERSELKYLANLFACRPVA